MKKDQSTNDDEIKIEKDDSLDGFTDDENPIQIIKKLQAKLKKIEAERQEYLTGWQRAKADLVNARKRDEAERAEFIKYANENIVEELIPVMGSFEIAMGNKEVWQKVDQNWRIGVEYIYSQLAKVLINFGVKEINPVNEIFDHNRHEAASHEVVTDEGLDHRIIQVIQKGYSLNGKVLKVPKVKVGEFKK